MNRQPVCVSNKVGHVSNRNRREAGCQSGDKKNQIYNENKKSERDGYRYWSPEVQVLKSMKSQFSRVKSPAPPQ